MTSEKRVVFISIVTCENNISDVDLELFCVKIKLQIPATESDMQTFILFCHIILKGADHAVVKNNVHKITPLFSLTKHFRAFLVLHFEFTKAKYSLNTIGN